jgi:hypothetical protein
MKVIFCRYISAYPDFLSLQTSNDDYDQVELQLPTVHKRKTNEGQHGNDVLIQSRRLLARDTSYLFFAVFFLCLSEKVSIEKDPLNFYIFNIVFEIIRSVITFNYSMAETILIQCSNCFFTIKCVVDLFP